MSMIDHDHDSVGARWCVSRRVSDAPQSPAPLATRLNTVDQSDAQSDFWVMPS